MSFDGESPQELLLSNLEFLRDRVEQLCRHHRAPPDAAEEVFGDLKVKLLENDYEVLRRFRGESRLTTYLSVVVSRFFQDWVAKEWGSWRRAAQGARATAAGEEVERLTARDGFSRDEALRIAAGRNGWKAGTPVPAATAPSRRASRPRKVPLEGLLATPAARTPDPEETLCAADVQRHLAAALERAVASLAPQDRLLVQLRFGHGLTVASIARILELRQRDLYTRINRALVSLRRGLQSEGLTWREVREHLGRMERLGDQAWLARVRARKDQAGDRKPEPAAGAPVPLRTASRRSSAARPRRRRSLW